MSTVSFSRIGRRRQACSSQVIMALKRFPGLVVEEMDEEILLYLPTTHQAIHLNSMAAAIWKLCDGTRTMKDLIDCFLAAYPNSKSSISQTTVTMEQHLLDYLHKSRTRTGQPGLQQQRSEEDKTARSTSTSDPRLRRAKSRTGSRPIRNGNSS